MSMHSSGQALQDAARTLSARWRRLEEVWRDDNARRFNAEHVEPVEDAVRHAVGAMEQLAEAMSAARMECERDD